MSLRQLALQNMTAAIVSLPPQLKEEIVGTTLKSIEVRIRAEVTNELTSNIEILSRGLVQQHVDSLRTGAMIVPPKYTRTMNPKIYYLINSMASNFVHDHGEAIRMMETAPQENWDRPARNWHSDSSSEEEYYDYP